MADAMKLLPCPMCGGEPALLDYEARYGGLHYASRCPQCTSCGCSMGYLPSASKAIAAWNRRASPADGVVVPRGEVTDEWADRFCEAVNWSPDGQECKVVEGEMRCVTFRQIAKGHILAAIATGPDAASPALAATSGGGEALALRVYRHLTNYAEVCAARRENIEQVRDEAMAALSAQPAPAGGGEAVNLGWFIGFARKHGLHVQADWLARFVATPPSADADKLLSSKPVDDNRCGDTADKLLIDPEDMQAIEDWINAGEPSGSVPGGRVKALWQALARLSTTEPTSTPADAVEGERS